MKSDMLENKKTNIYVVTHKWFNDSICQDKGFIPIAVGNELINSQLCKYMKDNTLDNISQKNPNFCELTAQYWIWKNDKIADVKGLCHYRRYFSKSNLLNSMKYIINIKYINQMIFAKHYDAIVSKRTYSYRGVKQAYLDCGYEKDLNITRDVIRELYPDYINSYDTIINGCWGYVANMLITTSKLFDQYSNWLFDILFEVEKRTDISKYSQQEARIYGYISERLLGVWIFHNKLRVKELRIVNIEQHSGIMEYLKSLSELLKINQCIKKIIFNIRGI